MTGTAEIRGIIPHRPPLLLLDRVLEVEPGRRLLARWTPADPGFGGPGSVPDPGRAFPVGALLESWAQAAVLLACWERPNPDVLAGKVALLAGIRNARVLTAAYPGQSVEHEVLMIRDLGDTVILGGSSSTDGRPVLEVRQLTLALRGAETLRAEPTDDGEG